MQAQQNQAPTSRATFVGALAFVSRTLATSVELFLHRRFGERYLGLHAAAVIPVVFVFATFWPGHDIRGLFVFLIAYLGACAAARVGIARRRRRGDLEHSYYNGRPVLMNWWPFKNAKERSVKGIEPFVVFFIGAILMPVSEPLGGYLMLAAAGLLVWIGLAETYERTRLLDMNDALVDQQNLAERLRNGISRR